MASAFSIDIASISNRGSVTATRSKGLFAVSSSNNNNNNKSNKNNNKKSNNNKNNSNDAPFQFTVTYEGRSCQVDAYENETILNAMERNSVMDTLCLPTMPSDCRRGNCMTCAGRVLVTNDAPKGRLVSRSDDGLSPHVSDKLHASDYVLLCSTHVIANGDLHIVLGENSAIWEELYTTRFTSREAETTKHETVAKLMTLRAEGNVPKWTAETEEVLEKTKDDDDGIILTGDDDGDERV